MKDIFPIMGVYDGVVASVKGALTVGWELEFPALFTLSETDYDSMVEAFAAALKILPAWTVMHRQDVYTYETYHSPHRENEGFLEASYGRHFEGRQYLRHRAYVYLTFGNARMIDKPSSRSGIFGIQGYGQVPTSDALKAIRTKCGEFVRILEGTGLIAMRYLSDADLLGSGKSGVGLIHSHMMLWDGSPTFSDVVSDRADTVRVYDRVMHAYTLGESRDCPNEIGSVMRIDSLSYQGTSVFLSTGACVGSLLPCEHEVNHYIVIPSQQDIVQKLDRKRKNMNAGISSVDNRINAAEVETYLDEVYRSGEFTVLAHMNILYWGREDEMRDIGSLVASSLTSMGMQAVYNEYDAPNLWYAGIPSNSFELGSDSLMTMELRSALCMGCFETFDSGFEKGALRVCDRTRNIPLTIDIDEEAQRLGYINNYNMFVLGGSGTGKSFTMNNILRWQYNSGAFVFVIDVGDSYEGLTNIIKEQSGGKDGQYFSWDDTHPLSFNPFIGYEKWLDDAGNLNAEQAGVNFILTFLETAYQPKDGWNTSNEPVLRQTISDFVRKQMDEKRSDDDLPILDDYFNFLLDVQNRIEKGEYMMGTIKVEKRLLDIYEFRTALKAYSLQGEFSYLMNDKHPADIFRSRFTVFEVDKLSQIKDRTLYSLVILAIFNSFDRKRRELSGKKIMVVEEAWKAIDNATSAGYIKDLWKTARKFHCSATLVTQSIGDILGSDIIKDAILANSDIRLLLDQKNQGTQLTDTSARGKDTDIVTLLGLTEKEVALLLSVNRDRDPRYNYREFFLKFLNGKSDVYAMEVSPEEAICYDSDKDRKRPFIELAKEKGSYVEAIKKLVASRQ